MKRPVCRVCGAAVVNGNLYCSKACGQVPKQANAALVESGFEQDPAVPNIYRKDGVAVTVEAAHASFEKTLRHHTHAVDAGTGAAE